MNEQYGTFYDAHVYWDDEANENAAADVRLIGYFPTKAAAVAAIRKELVIRGAGWNSGEVGRGELIEGVLGVRPDEWVSDDRYIAWNVGPTWCER